MWFIAIGGGRLAAVAVGKGTDCSMCLVIHSQCVSKPTSDQSSLTEGRNAATHGRFSRICQVVPICTTSTTPQSASAGTDAALLSLWVYQLPYMSGHVLGRPFFSLKIAPSHAGSDSHLTHGSLGPSESISKQHHDWFIHFCMAHSHDRQRDHATIICSNRPHTVSAAVRPKNSKLWMGMGENEQSEGIQGQLVSTILCSQVSSNFVN